VQQLLKGEADDAEWSAGLADLDACPLPIEAANCLVPGSLPIVGPERDVAPLKQYMQRVTQRAAKVGIQRMVFGSGGARKRPDDTPEDEAFKQIVEFAKIAADAAMAAGVVIVVEHLRQAETNTINSLADELRLIEAVDSPHLKALVDSYHMGIEGDSDEDLLALDGHLQHVHVAEPSGRHQPGKPAEGEPYDWEHFCCLLRKLGYDQRISFEGKWSGEVADEAGPMIQRLREAWDAAARCESR
jgi:sugar phosphate isomerase/epimerase